MPRAPRPHPARAAGESDAGAAPARPTVGETAGPGAAGPVDANAGPPHPNARAAYGPVRSGPPRRARRERMGSLPPPPPRPPRARTAGEAEGWAVRPGRAGPACAPARTAEKPSTGEKIDRPAGRTPREAPLRAREAPLLPPVPRRWGGVGTCSRVCVRAGVDEQYARTRGRGRERLSAGGRAGARACGAGRACVRRRVCDAAVVCACLCAVAGVRASVRAGVRGGGCAHAVRGHLSGRRRPRGGLGRLG
jgi:hypothetical protein